MATWTQNSDYSATTSIYSFFGKIVAEVESYRGDAFITFEELNKLPVNSEALIITQSSGMESCYTRDHITNFLSWKDKGISLYHIRITEDTPCGKQVVSAKLDIAEIENHVNIII